ncbi:BrnA antitoxin family protein [Pigmentiphaga litoralis]|uniref:Uncharacterized protein (DUF4415 family) n=1 Tax=Pigmentiphaga litoralis TaxID=516702 RepID=A0A7Y9IYR7_9BURK|nr:BrnA antitoxin family protein [Pigmentiphaga litoralis]NYE26359.1 uncharacterized protein (DUF4415 family) [Pigmentiphaga litoralis]NYE85479.1 uncharacterized protein (DUF4415 family) [Pigmentiphaga litoralis]
MPTLKPGTIPPTPEEDAAIEEALVNDADSYVMTDAEWQHASQKARIGRPKAETTKERITIRLSADVLAKFRATGPGWQTRINTALESWLAGR